MMRTAIKTAAAGIVAWSGAGAMLRNRQHDLPFVVYYHRVVEGLDATNGFALPAMEITAAMLERHLDWIGRHYDIISADEFLRRAGSRPRALITFDDGYSDIYHHAFPLLKRKGIPAAMFVVTDLVGSSKLPLHEELHALLTAASRAGSLPGLRDPSATTRYLLRHRSHAEVQRIVRWLRTMVTIDASVCRALRPLDWDMLAEMRDAGMTIGSHTRTHSFLTLEQEERVVDEIRSSRVILQQRLAVKADHFAYPGGCFNGRIVEAVASAGYTYGFSICRHIDGRNPLLTIPRRGLWEKSCVDSDGRFSAAIMSCQTTPLFDWISPCTQSHGAIA